MAAIVPIRAGQGLPQQPNDEVKADAITVVQGLQERIRQLEQRLLQGQLNQAENVGALEDQLFALSQERDALTRQLQESQRGFAEREAEILQLRRKQGQDTEQIQAGLQEIANLQQQLQRERAQVAQFREQLRVATDQIQQLTIRQQRLEEMHRETLVALRRRQHPESDILSKIGSTLALWIYRGLTFHDPKDYEPEEV